MYRILLTVLLVVIYSLGLFGQESMDTINVWKKALAQSKNDTVRLYHSFLLANGYRFSNTDSSFFYTDAALSLARKIKSKQIEAYILSLKGATLLEAGDLPGSMKYQFDAQKISIEMHDSSSLAYTLNRIGNIYMELADYSNANNYYFQSMALFKQLRDTGMYYNEVSNIGNIYALDKKLDSALYYQELIYDVSMQSADRRLYLRPEIMFRMGNVYEFKGETATAITFYKRGVEEALLVNDIRNLAMNDLQLARLYSGQKQIDSASHYAYSAYHAGKVANFRKGVYEASLLLTNIYDNNPDSAYKYLVIANVEREFLFGANRFREIQRLVLSQQQLEQQKQKESDRNASRFRLLVLLGVLVIMALLASYFFVTNRRQKKVNAILQEQREKISSQNVELEKTVYNLKSTQSQLIQSEKMASLGELTAGIAHEIQNPLNFVNNFSDLNKELIVELRAEIDAGNYEDVKAIANDIQTNEEKINHHGKRADSIVKGMLQHSRSSTGAKEPTDINALADEYLRLAFHGLRAKDKLFNAKLETNFDPSVGNIPIVSQDIGRVLLNLINNAFYAVDEKKRLVGEMYEAVVSISTVKINNHIEITVSDNGNGIPKKVIDKIFQPFFTTKPTGQGTGLGLSLSYDIVKAHGGEMTVDSTVGEGTRFVITIKSE